MLLRIIAQRSVRQFDDILDVLYTKNLSSDIQTLHFNIPEKTLLGYNMHDVSLNEDVGLLIYIHIRLKKRCEVHVD